MKLRMRTRVVTIVFVVGGLVAMALPASAAMKAKPPAAPPPPTVDVNDTNAVGTVGDNLLSLDEAIRLTNGSLTVSQLSASERRQVHGNVGPHAADLITFARPKMTILVSTPPVNPFGSAISVLRGNDGDTLDGDGATITSKVPDGSGLILSSSDLTVKNLTVRGFGTNVFVEFGGLSLRNISLDHLHLGSAVLSDLQAGASTSNGRLTGLSLTNSQVDGGSAANAISIAAGVSNAVPVSNALLEDVLLQDDTVIGALESTYVDGAAGQGVVSNAITRHVRILDNKFINLTGDATLGLAGAVIGEQATGSGTQDVLIQGNLIEGKSYTVISAVDEALYPGTVIRSAFVRNVTINHNQFIAQHNHEQKCIDAEAGRSDGGSLVMDSDFSHWTITNNSFTNCTLAAVVLHAGYGLTSATAFDNTFQDVNIAGNRVTGSQYGVLVQSGSAPGFEELPDDASPPSMIRGNRVTRVRITGNSFAVTDTGIRLEGGETVTPFVSVVTGNSIDHVVMSHNQTPSAQPVCKAVANIGLGAVANSITSITGPHTINTAPVNITEPK